MRIQEKLKKIKLLAPVQKLIEYTILGNQLIATRYYCDKSIFISDEIKSEINRLEEKILSTRGKFLLENIDKDKIARKGVNYG